MQNISSNGLSSSAQHSQAKRGASPDVWPLGGEESEHGGARVCPRWRLPGWAPVGKELPGPVTRELAKKRFRSSNRGLPSHAHAS